MRDGLVHGYSATARYSIRSSIPVFLQTIPVQAVIARKKNLRLGLADSVKPMAAWGEVISGEQAGSQTASVAGLGPSTVYGRSGTVFAALSRPRRAAIPNAGRHHRPPEPRPCTPRTCIIFRLRLRSSCCCFWSLG